MILQVSTNQSGGAGIAARRLHLALRESDEDSRFLSGRGVADPTCALEILPRRRPKFHERALSKVGILPHNQQRWERELQRLDCKEVFASSPHADSTLLEHRWIQQADIINLHWVAGVLPWRRFFKEQRCPVVWTLHDMNPFMGIFHYETDRLRASTAAQAEDDSIREQKRKMLRRAEGLTIVTPSRWLGKLSSQSEVLGHLRHEVIPNGVDTRIFKPFPQDFARSVFGLPQEPQLMMVAAEDLQDPRKGTDLLIDALQPLDLDSQWHLVLVGGGNVLLGDLVHHRLGLVTDERLMSLLYSAVDLVVIPSREDNLPNVILESLCCGTPVVGTPAGGIPELVERGRDGFIAEAIESEQLASAVRRATMARFDSELIAQHAASRFDQRLVAARYGRLYSTLN